jgi:hypothetical protein
MHAMNLRRKIAAGLAAIMAFGSAVAFAPTNVQAYVGNTAMVSGNVVRNYASGSHLVDNAAIPAAIVGAALETVLTTPGGGPRPVAHGALGRDIVIPANLLNVAGTALGDGSRALDLILHGNAQWDFNTSGLQRQGNPGAQVATVIELAGATTPGFHLGWPTAFVEGPGQMLIIPEIRTLTPSFIAAAEFRVEDDYWIVDLPIIGGHSLEHANVFWDIDGVNPARHPSMNAQQGNMAALTGAARTAALTRHVDVSNIGTTPAATWHEWVTELVVFSETAATATQLGVLGGHMRLEIPVAEANDFLGNGVTMIGATFRDLQAMDWPQVLAGTSYTVNFPIGELTITPVAIEFFEDTAAAQTRTLSIAGGVGPFTWGPAPAGMPAWLDFADGVFTATTTPALPQADVTVTVTATDARGIAFTEDIVISLATVPPSQILIDLNYLTYDAGLFNFNNIVRDTSVTPDVRVPFTISAMRSRVIDPDGGADVVVSGIHPNLASFNPATNTLTGVAGVDGFAYFEIAATGLVGDRILQVPIAGGFVNLNAATLVSAMPALQTNISTTVAQQIVLDATNAGEATMPAVIFPLPAVLPAGVTSVTAGVTIAAGDFVSGAALLGATGTRSFSITFDVPSSDDTFVLNVNIPWEAGEAIVMQAPLTNAAQMAFAPMADIAPTVINPTANFGITTFLLDPLTALANDPTVIASNNQQPWRTLIPVNTTPAGANAGNIDQGRFTGGYSELITDPANTPARRLSIQRPGTLFHTGTINRAARPNGHGAMHGGHEIPFRLDYNHAFRANIVRVTWFPQDALAVAGVSNFWEAQQAGVHLRIPIAIRFTGTGDVSLSTNPGLTGIGGAGNPTLIASESLGLGVRVVGTEAVPTGRLHVNLDRIDLISFSPDGFIPSTVPAADGTGGQARGFHFVAPDGFNFGNTLRINGHNIVVQTGNAEGNITATTLGGTAGVPNGSANTTAYLSHGGRILNVVIGANTTSSQFENRLRIENMTLVQTDLVNPLFRAETLNVRVLNGLRHNNQNNADEQADQSATATFGARGGRGAITQGTTALGSYQGAPVAARARFTDWGLIFTPDHGGASPTPLAIPSPFVSGRVYTEGMAALAAGFEPTVVGHFAAHSRVVRIEELAPQSAWGSRNIEFTLTDAEGNPHPYAAIAGVEFRSGRMDAASTNIQTGFHWSAWSSFHNRVPGPRGGAGTGAGLTLANSNGTVLAGRDNRNTHAGAQSLVVFDAGGQRVSVQNLTVENPQTQSIWLEARFFISSDVNFDGNVYVAITNIWNEHLNDPMFVQDRAGNPQGPIQIATIERRLNLESEVTNINIGFQSIPVANITLSETQANVLRTGREIQLSLSEFGVAGARTDMGFNAINRGNIAIDGHATATNRLDVTMLPMQVGEPSIRMSVSRTSSGTGSAITFQNLHVYANHSVPYGVYGVIARGNAILDNDETVLNWFGGTGINARQLAANESGFRRYGFGGLLFDPYINVITPGQGVPGGLTGIVGVQVGSPIATVGGFAHHMVNGSGHIVPVIQQVIGGQARVMVPVRGIADMLGADTAWDAVTRSVSIIVGDRHVIFTIDSTTYTVNGVPHTLDVPPTIPASGPGANTTYLPFRAVGEAFGITVDWHEATRTGWFNHPNTLGTGIVNDMPVFEGQGLFTFEPVAPTVIQPTVGTEDYDY